MSLKNATVEGTTQRPAELERQRVGVGVMVVRNGEVLFGRRRGAHGAGTWSLPGGHLEAGESVEACALRELMEETGLDAANPRLIGETEDVFPEGLRYRTLFVRLDWTRGEPAIHEPHACDEWAWFRWDTAPQPLFLPVANLRECWSSLVPQTKTAGLVEAIHIAADAGAPVRQLDSVRLVAALGVEGDRYAAGRGHYSPDHRVSRDLTLIEAEAIEKLASEHAIKLSPGEARRNLTTRGIALDQLLGRRFWVGGALCLGTRLCEPCQYLSDLTGKPLLRPLVHRGGLRADILQSGHIREGDSVLPVDESDDFASADVVFGGRG